MLVADKKLPPGLKSQEPSWLHVGTAEAVPFENLITQPDHPSRSGETAVALASYSVMTRSAHSTSETKMGGLPNFAPHWSKSVCITDRARLQAPQA
jgi:hypothetical protein